MENRCFIDEAKAYIGFQKVLKPEQNLCLETLLSGRDVLAILPTGFGKSLIYQLFPFVMSLKHGIPLASTDYFMLVITPLNSIMSDQCSSLAKQGIKSCAIDFTCSQAETYTLSDSGSDSDDDESTGHISSKVPLSEIERGLFQVVYVHPEALLKSRRGAEFMARVAEGGRLVGIAVDEAHMILEWGGEFRKDFSKIGDEILSQFPNVPALILTAIASPTAQQQLITSLKLKEPKLIAVNPDRPNIMYRKFQRPPSSETEDHLESILTPMVDELLEKKTEYPMTLFYADTGIISFSYAFFEKTMGRNQYIGAPEPENRLFAQYTQVYTDDMKKFIVTELGKENPKIRIVFATVALGMGLNAPHIRQVIHYKPPTSLEKYFQETGRAGRDGLKSTALLYYNGTDIRSNRPGIEKDIIQYCKNDSCCYRDLMLSHFGYQPSEHVQAEFCCDFCNN